MIDADDELNGASLHLVPCGICGVERPRSALQTFEGDLACARCRGKSYAEDDEEEEESEESEDSELGELDFDEGGEG